MGDQHSERRRHPRISARMPVRVSTIEPERDQWTGRPFFRATREVCANVSRGGVFVHTNEPLAPGRRVLVELALPSGKPVEAIGRVAWSKRVMTPGEGGSDSGIGVEFLGGSAEQFADLEAYLQEADAPAREPAPEG
jgi:uncharacterized protein (TIGR02266 family)